MAHSLEVRVPFLDHRVIEWALPRSIIAREGVESKVTLRDYVLPHVPPEVLSHPKQGFSLPILDEFNWKEALNSIRQSIWVRNGYWSSNWESLLEPDIPNCNARIWNLLMLTKWAEAWLK